MSGLEFAAARQASRILIADTYPVLTAVWYDMLTGARDPWFEDFTDTADLYLLTGIDMPWDDDGTRYFPGEATRQRFFDACKAELDRRELPCVTLNGDRAKRLAEAAAAIGKFFGAAPSGEAREKFKNRV